MAFTQSIDFKICVGDVWISGGNWNGAGVTTGELETQLGGYVYTVLLGSSGNGVQANDPSVDETLPGDIENGVVTIDFDSGATGTWLAVGRV